VYADALEKGSPLRYDCGHAFSPPSAGGSPLAAQYDENFEGTITLRRALLRYDVRRNRRKKSAIKYGRGQANVSGSPRASAVLPWPGPRT